MNDALPGFLDRRQLVYTYTMLNTYRSICPHQMERRYIVKDLPFVETPEMKWGTFVHSAMENRIQGGKPLPNGMQQWEEFAAVFDGRDARTEMKLAVTKFREACDYYNDKTQDPQKRVWLRTKADVVVLNKTTAYLADHKTGRIREDAFELELQACLLHAKFSHLKKIYGQYFWLKEQQVGKLYDLSYTDATWTQICQIIADIEQGRTDGEFEKRKSGLCSYCNVKDCENWKPRT